MFGYFVKLGKDFFQTFISFDAGWTDFDGFWSAADLDLDL
jgi:hypothetical protein